jgi:hypothetical protein
MPVAIGHDDRKDPQRQQLLALRAVRGNLERRQTSNCLARSHAVAVTPADVAGRLRELIAALDRRAPRAGDAAEAAIARDAAALRAKAEGRLAEIADQTTSLALSVMVLALSVPACGNRAPAREELTAWQPRGTWSGRGVQQTDPFISTTGLLRLTWETRGAPGAGYFRITLHSDVSGRPLLVPVDRQGPGKDVAYVTEDPRGFFLLVESADLDWRVDVAEGIPATRPRPVAPR